MMRHLSMLTRERRQNGGADFKTWYFRSLSVKPCHFFSAIAAYFKLFAYLCAVKSSILERNKRMYKSTPIPVLEGAAAQRFEAQAQQNESRRGSENYSEARAALKTILDRSVK